MQEFNKTKCHGFETPNEQRYSPISYRLANSMKKIIIIKLNISCKSNNDKGQCPDKY